MCEVCGAQRTFTVHHLHAARVRSWNRGWYVTVAATTVLAMCAVRVPSSQTIHLYINSSNNVVYQESTNDGSTWGSVQTVYSGGNAVLDLVVAYRSDGIVSNGPWFVDSFPTNGVCGGACQTARSSCG